MASGTSFDGKWSNINLKLKSGNLLPHTNNNYYIISPHDSSHDNLLEILDAHENNSQRDSHISDWEFSSS